MDEPKYLIMNPLQIELFLNERKIKTEIEERFYNKMDKLKNISLKNKRIKSMIQKINNRVILIDI